jgi:FixJ family two-component response regulator
MTPMPRLHHRATEDRPAGHETRRPVVHVVDDDPSFLRAIARRLEAAGFEVARFESAEAFLSRQIHSPGCAVLDLRMPGQGGLELQEAILREQDPLPVIFLTGQADVPSSVRAMKQGAIDFLTKPVSGEELAAAVRRAIELDASARAGRRRLRESMAAYGSLTPRERQVFSLVARGSLNKQIAAELGTSERTVKAHRARVMEKMGASSVADLARTAEQLREATNRD